MGASWANCRWRREADDAQPTTRKDDRLWKRRRALFDAAWRHSSPSTSERLCRSFGNGRRKDKDELKVGQIVLLSTEKPARGHWPRARVTGIKEAGRTRDGITRTVTVKLADGTEYSRPVQQLVRLELDYPDQDGVEAEAPLPGPSVLILVRLMTVGATTMQKRVGSVYSPTQYGMIHFKHRSRSWQQREEDPSSSGPRDQAIGETKSEFVTTSVQERRTRGRSD
jgi:hypothetical protein